MDRDIAYYLDIIVLFSLVFFSAALILYSAFILMEPKLSKAVNKFIESNSGKYARIVVFSDFEPCNSGNPRINLLENRIRANITAIRRSINNCILFLYINSYQAKLISEIPELRYIRLYDEFQEYGSEDSRISLFSMFSARENILVIGIIIITLLFYIWLRLEDIRANFSAVNRIITSINNYFPTYILPQPYRRQRAISSAETLLAEYKDEKENIYKELRDGIRLLKDTLEKTGEDILMIKNSRNLTPKQAAVLREIAYMYEKNFNRKMAKKYYNYAVIANDKDYIAVNNLAFIEYQEDNASRCVQLFETQIRNLRSKKDIASRAYLVIALAMLDRYREIGNILTGEELIEKEKELKLILRSFEFHILQLAVVGDYAGLKKLKQKIKYGLS